MKVARADKKDIDAMFGFFNDLADALDNPGGWGASLLSDEEILSLGVQVQDAWKGDVGHAWRRALLNLVTLLDHCADPDSDTLEFKPEIAEAMEHYAPGKF